ncbi:MAG: hypothetical protein KIT79_12800 [Deltaproteobacteria bacterium]|nr:hypothetical protein [Deltaproteobacteria bacterium]
MPALNFQKRFVPMIRSGEKCQTILAHRNDGRPPCKPGDRLKLYTGMRTKGCKLVATVEVISCLPVRIFGTGFEVTHEEDETDYWHGLSLYSFARLDGFRDWTELRDWFGRTHGLPFEGWLVRWDSNGSAGEPVTTISPDR